MLKKALVTGGSGDIGKAVVIELLTKGYAVAFTYANREKAAFEFVNEMKTSGYSPIAYKCDFNNREDIYSLAKTLTNDFGTFDIVVNCAGKSLLAPFLDTDDKMLGELMQVNFLSPFILTRQLLPKMLSRGYGSIVNVSSMWGEVGASNEVAYSATKAALSGFTKALAKELAASNIRVNAIALGVIDTKMNGHLSEIERSELERAIPLGRYGTPLEAAKAVVFLAENEYMTGEVMNYSGGYVI